MRSAASQAKRGAQQCLHNFDRPVAELRALAAWYREYAGLAGNPLIWLGRLSTAEELERQASAAESAKPSSEIEATVAQERNGF